MQKGATLQPPTQGATIPGRYVINVTLSGGQVLAGQLRQAIDNDSDFLWRGVSASCNSVNLINGSRGNSTFSVRFNDGSGYYFMTNYINSQFLTSLTGLPCPYVIYPQFIFAAGSYIGIDIQDTTGAPPDTINNVIQLVFWGARRYLNMDAAVKRAIQKN